MRHVPGHACGAPGPAANQQRSLSSRTSRPKAPTRPATKVPDLIADPGAPVLRLRGRRRRSTSRRCRPLSSSSVAGIVANAEVCRAVRLARQPGHARQPDRLERHGPDELPRSSPARPPCGHAPGPARRRPSGPPASRTTTTSQIQASPDNGIARKTTYPMAPGIANATGKSRINRLDGQERTDPDRASRRRPARPPRRSGSGTPTKAAQTRRPCADPRSRRRPYRAGRWPGRHARVAKFMIATRTRKGVDPATAEGEPPDAR